MKGKGQIERESKEDSESMDGKMEIRKKQTEVGKNLSTVGKNDLPSHCSGQF